MAKQTILLIDSDPRGLRILEVSLRKAGYDLRTAISASEGLSLLEQALPDLVLLDTRLSDMDGFVLVERLRARTEWARVPVMFLSSDGSVESKVRGLELGVEDYLTKPMYIKEVLTRVQLVLQRKGREGIELRTSGVQTRFSGSLSDMGIVDLLQTVDLSRKSGVIYLSSGRERGAIYFREGKLVDAELGRLRAEPAVYRFLVWNEGNFEVVFRSVRREDRMAGTTQAVLMEGLRRLDEWSKLVEKLPPLTTVMDVLDAVLMEKLSDLPDEANPVLRLMNGRRSLQEVLDECPLQELATLAMLVRLNEEGLIYDTGKRISEYPPARTDSWNESLRSTEPSEPPVASEPGTMVPQAEESPEESLRPTLRPSLGEGHVVVPRLPTLPPPATTPLSFGPLSDSSFAPPKPGTRSDRSRTPALGTPMAAMHEMIPSQRPIKFTPPLPLSSPPVSSLPTQIEEDQRFSAEPSTIETALPVTERPVTEHSVVEVRQAIIVDSGPISTMTTNSHISDFPAAQAAQGVQTAPAADLSELFSEKLSNSIAEEAIDSIATHPISLGPDSSDEVTEVTNRASPSWPSSSEAIEDMSAGSRRAMLIGISVGLGLVALVGGYAVHQFWLPPDSAPTPKSFTAHVSKVAPHATESSNEAIEPTQQNTVSTEDTAVPKEKTTQTLEPDVEATPQSNSAPSASSVDLTKDLEQARTATRKGERKTAEELYQKLIAAYPFEPAPVQELAFMYLRLAKYAQAVELAQRATELDATSSQAWVVLGAARDALGNRSAARDAYRQCAEKGKGPYVSECRLMIRSSR